MTALQGSLLDADLNVAPRLAELGEGLVRLALSREAWVDHRLGWVQGSDAVFDRLESCVSWRSEKRQMYERVVEVPRLVSWYDTHAVLPHAVLKDARQQLSAYYADDVPEGFATAGLCLYRDGRDSVAWHGDTIGPGRQEDRVVAIISLGAPRALLLRPRGGGTSRKFTLGHGDLLVMGGSCQRTWEHAVPKTARPCGPRISVQFRPPGVR